MSTCIYIRSQHSNSVVKVAAYTVIERILEERNPVWYVADGTEGNTLTFDGSTVALVNGVEVSIDLRGKTVTSVNRENYEQKPTLLSNPTNKEFNWTSSTAALKQAINLEEGEQLKINYK